MSAIPVVKSLTDIVDVMEPSARSPKVSATKCALDEWQVERLEVEGARAADWVAGGEVGGRGSQSS